MTRTKQILIIVGACIAFLWMLNVLLVLFGVHPTISIHPIQTISVNLLSQGAFAISDWIVDIAVAIFFTSIIVLGIAAIVSNRRRMSAIQAEFRGREIKQNGK